jgi:methylmalonyl-CoA/ethylmalonyl-CoA epimerase
MAVLPAGDPTETVEFATDLGATFDHFAIAARRIRDLLPLWSGTLGGRFALGADNPQVGWRTLRLEFGGVVCIELIEPLPPSTLFDRFFESHPNGGLHHVTFLVDDVQEAHARLTRNGYQPFGSDESWYQLFVHPRNANGVLVQLMVRREYRLGREPITMEDVLAGHGYNGTGIPSP